MKLSTSHYQLLLFVLVIATFARLFSCDFAVGWDDGANLTQNPNLNPPTLGSVAKYWIKIGKYSHMAIYMPVTFTVWGAVAKATYLNEPDEDGTRLNSWVFHGVNVLLHACTALAAFELLRRLFKSDLSAFLGAAIYAIHPMQVEPVGWVAGMKDILYGFFALLACISYLAFLENTHPKKKRQFYMVGTAFLLLSMFSKPTGVVTPVLAFLLDRLTMKDSYKAAFKRLGLWFALSIPIMVIARISQVPLGICTAPIPYRPLIALDSISFYLWKYFVPFNYTVEYTRTAIRVVEEGWVWYTWIPAVIVGIVLYSLRKKDPRLPLAGLWMVVCIGPVLGFVQFHFQYLSGVANHYMYIASLGIVMILTSLHVHANKKWLTGIYIALIPLLAIRSLKEQQHWQNDFTLMTRCIEHDPEHSFVGTGNLGARHMLRHEYGMAEPLFRKALSLRPEAAYIRDNLATVLIATDRTDEGIAELKKSLDIGERVPQYVKTNPFSQRLYLGLVLLKLNRLDEAQEQADNLKAKFPDNLNVKELQEKINKKRAEIAATQPSRT